MGQPLDPAVATDEVDRRERLKQLRAFFQDSMGGDAPRIASEIEAAQLQVSHVSSRISQMEERLVTLRLTVQALQDVQAEAALAKVRAEGRGPDWAFLIDMANAGEVADQAFSEAAQAIGLWPDGYYQDTNQRAVSLALVKDDPASLHRTVEAVKAMLPHYRPRSDGYVRFGIFESTLGEYGSYSMNIKPDLSAIFVGKPGRWQSFPDIERAVAHVQQNHWYTDEQVQAAAPRA